MSGLERGPPRDPATEIHPRAVVLNLCGPRSQFPGRDFFHRRGTQSLWKSTSVGTWDTYLYMEEPNLTKGT